MAVAERADTSLPLADLDEVQRTDFRDRGYCIVRGALTPELAGAALEACDRIAEAGGQRGKYFNEKYPDKIEYRNLVDLDELFIELMTIPTVFSVVARLLGPNIHLMASHFIYNPSTPPEAGPSQGPGRWHRDVIGLMDDLGPRSVPMLSVRAAYYLTDVREPGSGITVFAPGTHRSDVLPELDPVTNDPKVVDRPEVDVGDAIIWDNRTYHNVEGNWSGRTRKALLFQYGFRWLAPHDYVQQRATMLDRCDAVQRQLLSSSDLNEDGSIARMKGNRALTALFSDQQLTYVPGAYTDESSSSS